MNLILHLPPETEAKLLAQAAATGKDAESLALEALRDKLAADEASPMLPLDQWHARFDAMLATMPLGNPDADLGRDSIYDGRGDPTVAAALLRYASWLRKKYEFPVRLPVYLLPGEQFETIDGESVVSSFFAPFDRAEEPYIGIATGDYPGLKKREGRDNALAAFIASLNHELVYYWQWVESGTTSERGVAKKAVGMLREYEKAVSHP